VVLALALAACGGDSDSETDSGSQTASVGVGDCIDAENNVVDCDSSSATKELVSDQSEPDAIACVTIGDKPQVEVTVGDGKFCAEKR
jgi:hypothetical protein